MQNILLEKQFTIITFFGAVATLDTALRLV